MQNNSSDADTNKAQHAGAGAKGSVSGDVLREKVSDFFSSITQLYFSRRGRLSRGRFWRASLVAWLLFWVAFALLDGVSTVDLTRIPALILIAALFCLCSRRYHDLDRSSLWLLLLLVPVLGVLVVIYELGFRRGSVGENRYGTDPRTFEALDRDYATVS